jgi:hypothetical protein
MPLACCQQAGQEHRHQYDPLPPGLLWQQIPAVAASSCTPAATTLQDLQRAQQQNVRAARNLLPALEDAVDDMGRQLAPAFERQYRMGKQHLEQSFPDLQLPEPLSSRPIWG